MAAWHTFETFVRPAEVARMDWMVPARHYNRCRLFLGRSDTGCVFIPIRTMQYMGVVDTEEIVFVDSQGGYVQEDGVGGRPILISWQPRPGATRQDLNASVPCQVIYYRAGLEETQRRLVSELGPALDRLEEKFRSSAVPAQGARIIPLSGE